MPTTTFTCWGAHLFEAMFVNLARRIRDDAATRLSDGDVGIGTGLDRLRIALALLRSRGDVAHLRGGAAQQYSQPLSCYGCSRLNGTL